MGEMPGIRPYTGGQQYPIIAAIEGYAESVLGANRDLQRLLKSAAEKRKLAALDQDDIVQESFFTVLHAAHRYDAQRGEPGHYLIRALANTALNLNRLERRHWSHREQEQSDRESGQADVLLTLPDLEAPDPEQMAQRQHSIQQVRDMLAALPASLSNLFDLLYVDELTQREVSKRMGVSQARVAQLHRDLLDRGKAYFGVSARSALD